MSANHSFQLNRRRGFKAKKTAIMTATTGKTRGRVSVFLDRPGDYLLRVESTYWHVSQTGNERLVVVKAVGFRSADARHVASLRDDKPSHNLPDKTSGLQA